jgi:hypothetical protein
MSLKGQHLKRPCASAGKVEQHAMGKLKVLVQATTRAGGDLHPVAAVVGGLVQAGHDVVVLCDAPAQSVFVGMGADTILSEPEYEVGPVVKASLRETSGREPEERQAHM